MQGYTSLFSGNTCQVKKMRFAWAVNNFTKISYTFAVAVNG
jgi:hypothetical protein